MNQLAQGGDTFVIVTAYRSSSYRLLSYAQPHHVAQAAVTSFTYNVYVESECPDQPYFISTIQEFRRLSVNVYSGRREVRATSVPIPFSCTTASLICNRDLERGVFIVGCCTSSMMARKDRRQKRVLIGFSSFPSIARRPVGGIGGREGKGSTMNCSTEATVPVRIQSKEPLLEDKTI
ncbi:unnamed protein product [Cyprideis torosa]|uniref:Uncharacterized protein n=1 Tax=Cyprideis torosa TaxID=163714 RepID=A0A7R8ZFW5_9CRUS|nr:unnamed protein product [Cyprideis torosa]CAG0880067.1 unnamed protein product [Cyprideis torosa]